ncbi:MAG: tetratricopeptide repeat protein [Magnetococcales bacterium]|nr:tetratricopeptide repeat protein [Magnetococcales bacterium]
MNEKKKSQTAGNSQPQITIDEAFSQELEHFNGEFYTQADQLCTAIIQAVPNHSYAFNLLGLIAQKLNRHDLAVEQFQKAMDIDSSNPLFYYNLGISLYGLGRLDEAVNAQKKALSIHPNYAEAYNSLGNVLIELKKLDEAIEYLQKAIEIQPKYAYAHYNFANALFEQGKLDNAISCYQKAIFLKPGFADAHNNLGIVLQEQNKHKKAVSCYQKAIAINPDFADAHSNLGSALREIGQLDAAIISCQKAIAINPGFADAYCNLGNAQLKFGNLNEAVASFEKAIVLKPDLATAYYNLGVVFHKQIKFAKAILCNQKAIAIQPGFANAYCNLGFILTDQSRYDEAVKFYKKAMAIEPDNASIHSNLILCIDLFSDVTSDLCYTERKKWVKQHVEPIQPFTEPFENIPNPTKKLRIGYVGADFLYHSAAHIFGAMLLNYNANEFEIFCYVGNTEEDKLTAQFKEKATSWQLIAAMDDAALADKIKQDGVDILVDLAGHTKGNRLLTFARKPAPLQVSAWGYPLGTNMTAMDYLFSDPFFIPVSKRGDFTEKVIDLPCVIHMLADTPFPEVIDPPACDNGYVTFGAFNRLEKYNDGVFTLWAEILQRIPTAKLLFKTVRLDSPTEAARIVQIFQNLGITQDRLVMIGKTSREEHLKAHGKIDIMLDPFPHSSGMTSLESVRMGVPVLNCETKIRGPISSAIMHILGEDEWRCVDEAEYVAKAIKFANDIQYLKTLRYQLQDRFDESVLGNSKLYTQEVETIYRQLWKKWCEGKK